MSTLCLGLRFSLRGAREGRARLILTAFGIAVAVGLLLFTISGFNGLKARALHAGWLQTGASNIRPSVDESSSDPLWWLLTTDVYDGRAITIVQVAATGPRSPLAPGLDRQPAAGEYFVSPALAGLLDSTPSDLLGERFPGTRAGVLSGKALVSPESLIAVVGRTPAELERLQGMQVRSIETAPKQHDYSDFLRIALGIGAIGLMLPVLVFVITSTRLAAARREERLAALRLVGATPGQVDVIAAVEAVLAAIMGTALGFVLFFAFRPLVAQIPFTGEPFFTADVSLGWLAVTGAVLGVPIVAVAASLITLRRVRISPLGVTRKAPARRPRAITLLVPVVGIALLLVPGLFRGSMLRTYSVFVVFAFIALGIMVAGPWLTYVGGRLLGALARRDSTLIAARRLGSDPRRGFRAISGLVMAVFMGTVFVSMIATAVQDGTGTFRPLELPAGTVVKQFAGSSAGYLEPAAGGRVAATVSGLSGVRAVVPVLLPSLPEAPADGDGAVDGGATGLVTAQDWALLGGSPTAVGSSGYVGLGFNELSQGYLQSRDGSLPVDGRIIQFMVLTDGSQTTIERVRTALEVATPDSPLPYSLAEQLSAGQNAFFRLLGRMVDVGVLICLIIAGCSLAVSVAGGLVDRRRAFALLRLTGMPVSHLYRAVLLEAAVPLVLGAVISAAVGFLVAAVIIWNTGGGLHIAAPGPVYFGMVVGGLIAALAVVGATLPLVRRLTEPRTARME